MKKAMVSNELGANRGGGPEWDTMVNRALQMVAKAKTPHARQLAINRAKGMLDSELRRQKRQIAKEVVI